MANEDNQQVDIFSRVISVPSIVNDFSDEVLNSEYHLKEDYVEAINRYGTIIKQVSFSEAKTEDLARYCKEWIRRNYYDGIRSFSLKAIDLAMLGYQEDSILVGDRVAVEYTTHPEVLTPIVRRMTCLSAQYDIMKPENSTFQIGVPETSASIKYRESVSVNQKITKPPTTPTDDGTTLETTVQGFLVEWGLLDGLGLDPDAPPDPL